MPNLLNLNRRARGAREVAPHFAVTDLGGGEAEIVLYGDVVPEDSRDWWTGEREGRQEISAEAFNEQYPSLKAASHITVRLNSCGGDVFTGLAIYHALKALPATVTVRIEGIAASSASVIACAGDEVVAQPGSIFMVHEAIVGVCGYYGRAELALVAADLEASVKAIADVYAAKTGKPVEELMGMMAAETWLVGQEVVDAGFADALERGDGPGEQVEDGGGGDALIAGVRHDLSRFRHVPDLAARVAASERAARAAPEPPGTVEAPAARAAGAHSKEPPQAASKRGETFMDVTELRERHPDLVAEIEAAAAAGERARIAEIDQIAGSVPAQMAEEAKYGEHPMTAQALALAALKAERSASARLASDYAAAAIEDAENSGAAKVAAAPAGAPGDGGDEASKAMAYAVATVNAMRKQEVR